MTEVEVLWEGGGKRALKNGQQPGSVLPWLKACLGVNMFLKMKTVFILPDWPTSCECSYSQVCVFMFKEGYDKLFVVPA